MFKVAILQKRPINEQIDKNIETIIMAMEEASENHADILLLPKSHRGQERWIFTCPRWLAIVLFILKIYHCNEYACLPSQ